MVILYAGYSGLEYPAYSSYEFQFDAQISYNFLIRKSS